MHWSPESFWKSTLHELMTANRGYIKANKDPNEVPPASVDEFRMLVQKLDKAN